MSKPIIETVVKDSTGRLIITGTNFEPGNTVEVGGVQVEIEPGSFSSTQITTKVIDAIQFNPVISTTQNTGFAGKYLVVDIGGINYKLALLSDPDQV